MPFRPFENLNAQPVLQFLQLTAQIRLAGMAAFRGSAEMEFLGDGNKVLKIPCVHVGIASASVRPAVYHQ